MKGSILDLAVAMPRHYIKMEHFAAERDIEPNKLLVGLGIEEMAICAPGEDTVTLAASAAWELLEKHPDKRKEIGLCIAGTETGVDSAKSLAVYLHGLLKLPSACRVFETKHACYAGTAALQMALGWAHQHPKRYALIIASDIARYERHSPGEPTQGGGAVAMLVGMADAADALLQLSPISGLHASDVNDFWRPSYQSTAMVRGKYSMSCYLEGLEAAYLDYRRQVDNLSVPDHLLFHVPFPNMAQKAHRRLMEIQGMTQRDVQTSDFALRVSPSLWANRRVGNIYTGSLYLALAGLCERKGQELAGQEVALFSYGSGSCSEYFTGTFGQRIAQPRLEEMMSQRIEVDIHQYERLMDACIRMEKNGSYQLDLPGTGAPYTYTGIHQHERIYRNNVSRAYRRSHAARANFQSSPAINAVV